MSELRLGHRAEVALEGLAAIALTLLIGVLGALVAGALIVGIVLSILWIGLPIIIAALAAFQALSSSGDVTVEASG